MGSTLLLCALTTRRMSADIAYVVWPAPAASAAATGALAEQLLSLCKRWCNLTEHRFRQCRNR